MIHTDVLLSRAADWNDEQNAERPGRQKFFAVCIALAALVFTLWQIRQAVRYTGRALRSLRR